MTASVLDPILLPGCDPFPARECRCDEDLPCQDPGEAARCAKCGLRLAPERAVSLGALPEFDDFDPSADSPPAEDAEGPPTSALRGPGPVDLTAQDGRPRRYGSAAPATAGPLGPGSPELSTGDAA